jgi:MOSC domain-containing protein YiiM
VTPLRLLSVQVGRVAPLSIGDQRVMSGIRKRAVAGPVAVEALGLAGDEQADLTVHGGLAKAVYAYPTEHYGFWRERRRTLGLADDLPNGSLGENLTVQGLLESELFVGDVLRFR